ncbi:MAG: hypothetical protein OXJ53_07425 [Gammaproteobacteria bacterium]|nr:hypothetical protein [Gammaproteobacteria bacterium]
MSEMVIDAEFNPNGERIVAISADKLVVIGPNGGEVKLEMPTEARAVSVSPDGTHAAVGHDGWVSHVDLESMRVLATHGVPALLDDVVLDVQGNAHGFPGTGQHVEAYSVDLATGAVRKSWGGLIREQTQARLHPSGTRIYGADTGLSPSDLERYSIVDGALRLDYDSPYHGEYEFWGNVWFDADGAAALTPCGVVVRLTHDRGTDLRFAMQLNGLRERIRHASSSAFDDLWFVVEESDGEGLDRVLAYDIETGESIERFETPLVDEVGDQRWLANFVFASAHSRAHYVVAGDGIVGSGQQALLVRRPGEFFASNRPPTASVPRFLTARVSEEIALDGTSSSDPEGVPLTFSWSLVSGPDEDILSPDALKGSVVRFSATAAGTYEFKLRVNDGERESPVARSTVNVFERDASLVHRLDHAIADAEYSASLHALVYLSADANEIRILDLSDLTQRSVALDHPPRRVGLSPNGLMAAVSHSGVVSLVDLRAGVKTGVQTFPAEWGDIILDGRSLAHLVPFRDQWVSLHSLDFASDLAADQGPVAAGSKMRMHPTEDLMYVLDSSELKKFNVSRFPPVELEGRWNEFRIGGVNDLGLPSRFPAREFLMACS